MGLDVFEMILEIEDVFNVKIPESRYQDLVTVGDMHDFIVQELAKRGQLRPVSDCASTGLFLRLRRKIVDCFSTDLRHVRPKTSTEATVPVQDRREAWKRLGDGLGLRIPKLVHPAGLRGFALVASFTLALVGIILSIEYLHFMVATFFLLFGWMFFYQLFINATPSLATTVPSECLTLRGLVWSLRKLNPELLQNHGLGWSSAEAWDAIQTIIYEQLDVAPDKVNRTTRWQDDLLN
jgi:acyl carrier protein